MHTKHVNVITLGCPKNIVDSEFLLGKLEKNGWKCLHDADEYTEVCIINTCGFIFDAKEESVDTILQFVEAKRKGKVKKIIVMGCLSERYKTELQNEIPEVDAFYGVDQIDEIAQDLDAGINDPKPRRLITTPSHYAYLKIAEGCDRQCSFCAIPGIRGKYISKSIEALLEECEVLAEKKVKELLLVAQDLSYYGNDLDSQTNLARLVRKILDKKLFDWVRLHYLYPGNISVDLLELLADRDDLCNYIDIPLQHISNNMLKAMKRGVSKTESLKLLETIRNNIPDAVIRTVFMVGFPGETEDDFKELLSFVKDFEFDRLGVFTYSHEEGTPAYQLKDAINQNLKNERRDILLHEQQTISLKKNQALIGKSLKAIVERKEGRYWIGRSQYDAPEIDNEILISSDDISFRPGDFLQLKITDAEVYDLHASVLKAG